ncbi:MAG: hypothetical protein Q9171_005344 [Xanthocarpia ochracea]
MSLEWPVSVSLRSFVEFTIATSPFTIPSLRLYWQLGSATYSATKLEEHNPGIYGLDEADVDFFAVTTHYDLCIMLWVTRAMSFHLDDRHCELIGVGPTMLKTGGSKYKFNWGGNITPNADIFPWEAAFYVIRQVVSRRSGGKGIESNRIGGGSRKDVKDKQQL